MPGPVHPMNGNLFITIQTTRHIQPQFQGNVQVAMVVTLLLLSLASIAISIMETMIGLGPKRPAGELFREQDLIS